MLIPFKTIIRKYNPKITGIIQAGAHFAEEHDEFENHGVKKLVYIEPGVNAFGNLFNRFSGNEDVLLFNVAAGSRIFETEMNVETANQGQSNSILRPLGHLKQHPEIKFHSKELVTVVPIDTLGLNPNLYNFMMLDCQGYELEILKGATETLKHIDYLYTEVNRANLYADCAKVWEIDEYLTDFTRVETAPWVGDWSDAFYIRKGIAA